MRTYLLAAAIGAFSCCSAWAAGEIREGRWQYTSTVQMDGMPQMQNMPKMPEGMKLPPGMKMPSMGPNGMTTTYETCVTKDNPVPQNPEGESRCKTTRMERKGNRINWATSCTMKNGETAQAEGEGSYSGDRSEMTIKTHTTHKGQPIDSTMHVKGQYLGACAAK